jgi:hypothetical protein
LPFRQGRANWRWYPSGHLRDMTEEHEKISFRKSSSWSTPLWHSGN